MNILIGVDIEKTKRFKLHKNFELIKLIFTKKEIAYCQKKEPHIAFTGKFCAKEAIVKAYKGQIDIRNIEVLNSSSGDPEIYISGKKMENIQCSISHTDDYAVAVAIIIT